MIVFSAVCLYIFGLGMWEQRRPLGPAFSFEEGPWSLFYPLLLLCMGTWAVVRLPYRAGYLLAEARQRHGRLPRARLLSDFSIFDEAEAIAQEMADDQEWGA